MPRSLPSALFAALALTAAGCCVPEREALRPLPEGRVFTYDELYVRLRAQAGAALEAFYADSWPELEEYARGLKQTAARMPKTSAIPTALQSRLDAQADGLQKDADALATAARQRRVRPANEAMQRIQLAIRQLRPGENLDVPPPKSPPGGM